eukprot:scaffold41550_cov191-Amphora_coffeaeformis.AAC.1
MMLAILVAVTSLSTTVQGNMFSLNNLFQKDDGNVPYLKDEQGRRFMLLETGDKVDVFQLSSNTRFEDSFGVPRMIYNVRQRFDGANTFSEVNATVDCVASSNTQPIRELTDCECSAVVKDALGVVNNCTCGVCAQGFGDSSIYFDCQNDSLIENCTSVDCGYTCNGPCVGDCERSTEECPLCSGASNETIPDEEPVTDVQYSRGAYACEIDTEGVLTCTDQAQLSLPDRTSSEFNLTVTCQVDPLEPGFDANDTSIFDYRKANDCECNIMAQDGQPSEFCRCSVCSDGFGENPVGIVCSGGGFAIAECPYVDCISECGGTCMNDCDFAGEDCPICVDGKPIDPSKNCYDFLTLETPDILQEISTSYFGIMFNVSAGENSLEILSLEFAAKVSEFNETSVDVSINRDGYTSTIGDTLTSPWQRVGKSTVSSDGTSLFFDELDEILISANETISLYIAMDGPWLLANNQDQITEGADLILYSGLGLTSTGIDSVDDSTSPHFSGKVNYRLQRDCKDCPICSPPTEEIPLVFASPNITCKTTETDLICNIETRVTAPNETIETFSDLEIEVQCDVKSPADDHDFRSALGCMCEVNVTDHLGAQKNCACSVCPSGFGPAPVIVECLGDFVVAECSRIDCNSKCNGDCLSNCEISGSECSLCTDEPALSQSPTRAPTPMPTSAPTTEQQTLSFEQLTVRLEGGIQLTEETRSAFEATTESFYRSSFRTQPASRRRLQELEFTTFDTEVVATREDYDTRGNSVTYDQTITFRTVTGDVVDKDQAGDLLLFQLTDPVQKKEYMELLKLAHPDFESIIEVNPEESRSTDDDSGLDLLLIIIIAAGIALCCCCCCCILLILLSRRKGDEHEKDPDYDDNDDIDPDAPEGPAFDISERSGAKDKFDNSEQSEDQDHTDFSQEQINGKDMAVPFGGEGNSDDDDDDDDGSDGSYGIH